MIGPALVFVQGSRNVIGAGEDLFDAVSGSVPIRVDTAPGELQEHGDRVMDDVEMQRVGVHPVAVVGKHDIVVRPIGAAAWQRRPNAMLVYWQPWSE
jgi:hypothetical protein